MKRTTSRFPKLGFVKELGGGVMSPGWRWSLSHQRAPPSCLSGLNCSNTTHLPPITLQLFPITMDYYTPPLLLLCLVVLYVYVVLVTVFSLAGYTCTVCRFPCSSRLPVLFLALLAFLLLKDAYLHLDPDPLSLHGDISHRTVTMWPLTDFKGQWTCKSSLILKYNVILCECLNWKTFWMYCIEAVGYFRK